VSQEKRGTEGWGGGEVEVVKGLRKGGIYQGGGARSKRSRTSGSEGERRGWNSIGTNGASRAIAPKPELSKA